MFKDCILIERRNWHYIYEIEKDLEYWIDFRDWWWATASSLSEAERISDEYNQIYIDQEYETMEDLVSYEDTF